MRYTLARRGRQTPSSRVLDILQRERDMGLDRTETYARFAHRVQESAKDLRELLQRCAEEGEDVVGYGATSKSTTIYNYAGIGPDLVRGIYDSSPAKQHTFSPGMHIPILPESNFSESPARLAFLGAWNHEVEIREKNRAFEVGGGRWITHVPKVRIIGG